jgi:anthranilate/para-aminobenzoate synthase component II
MVSKKFIINGTGHILLTSPHTIKTLRVKEIHLNELYIFSILTKLYHYLGETHSTLFTFNHIYYHQKKLIPKDPNFLKKFSNEWFVEFERLSLKRDKVLHIDFHGMGNGSTKNDLEFGLKSLELTHPSLSYVIKNILHYNFSKLGIKFGFDSQFQGYKTYAKTVTEQGNILGFTSFQIELSLNLRKRLVDDNVFLDKFARTIKMCYDRLFNYTPNEKIRVGIITIPVYTKLAKNIKSKSYLSKDYRELIRNRLDCQSVPIPFDLPKSELLRQISNVNALIIPGGSYGNGLHNREDKAIFRLFINNLYYIIQKVKHFNKQGRFYPIIGVCLGFQILCLEILQTFSLIKHDILTKDKGIITKQIIYPNLCQCNLKQRFEKLHCLPHLYRFDDIYLKLFWFSNERIIYYNDDNLKKLSHLDVTSIYFDRKDNPIIASIKYKDYPFLGFQFHPEKYYLLDNGFTDKFYQNLKSCLTLPYYPYLLDRDIKHYSYDPKRVYINKQKIIYYLF